MGTLLNTSPSKRYKSVDNTYSLLPLVKSRFLSEDPVDCVALTQLPRAASKPRPAACSGAAIGQIEYYRSQKKQSHWTSDLPIYLYSASRVRGSAITTHYIMEPIFRREQPLRACETQVTVTPSMNISK